MNTAILRRRGARIESASAELRFGDDRRITEIPALLASIVTDGDWQRFETKAGDVVEHTSFTEFITTPPLAGLGTTATVVERICKIDPDSDDARLVLAALRNDIPALANVGRPFANAANGCVTTISGRDAGYVVARLKRDDPELAAQVINGTLTAHAAALKAGIRRPRITIPADNLTAAIARIEAHYGVTIEVHE